MAQGSLYMKLLPVTPNVSAAMRGVCKVSAGPRDKALARASPNLESWTSCAQLSLRKRAFVSPLAPPLSAMSRPSCGQFSKLRSVLIPSQGLRSQDHG